MVWKTLVAQQKTNAQLNSHMALAENRTRVTLVRGERITHKPTMPPWLNIPYTVNHCHKEHRGSVYKEYILKS